MEQTINERINILFQRSKEKSIRQYAIRLGIAPTTLNECIKGAEPRHSLLKAVLDGEPSISPAWLLTGDGPMLKPNQPSSVYQSGMNANYQGTFAEPIHTQIGDVGGDFVGQDFSKGKIQGDGNIGGAENSISVAEQGKPERLVEAKAEISKLRQEVERLTSENFQLKEANELLKKVNEALRKSKDELHKSLIEEKERMIKILLEKK